MSAQRIVHDTLDSK